MANTFTDAQWRVIKGLQCQLCDIENNGVPIVIDNSLGDGSATLEGDGSMNSPLYVNANAGDADSIYTVDGEIQSNRIVTIPLGTSLSFEGTATSTIELNTSAAYSLTLGAGANATQFISNLGGLSLSYSGGVRLIRGDSSTTNYSSLTMAPGTSSAPLWQDVNGTGGYSGVRIDGTGSATGVNYSRLEAVGSVGGIGTNAKAQLTPTNFTIQRTIGAPPDIAVFTVGVNTGQVTLATPLYQSAAFLSTNSTGVLTKVAAMTAIADLTPGTATAEEVATAFNTLLAELRTAGLLAT